MFDADRPILSAKQDRLGRGTFAKYLARCMLDHTSPESLVVSLEGGWGSGKTSLINLVLEELHFASSNMLDAERPIILNFSPWSYSGQNQLVYGFFRRLSSELRQCEYLENKEDIIELVELYASFFTQQPVPKSLKLKSRFMRKSKTSKADAYSWESGRDPIQVKTALNNILRKQKHKIIIMIDNISRLNPAEINQILQIVKSMGDYVNTIYLLSFDKEQVVDAINQIHPSEGHAYLEKLVQLPFAIPEISKQDLENLLFDRLAKIIEILPEGTWQAAYWADIYYTSLKHFFNTSRDITRYVNALGFSFPRVKDVVNPVDFFALTVLEIFAEPVFLGIRQNKDLFTDLLDNVFVLDADKIKKDRARCDEILQRTTYVSTDVLLDLLILIFPRLRSLYRPHELYYHSESLARKNLRACSPDTFDIYFRLSLQSGSIADSEMNTLITLSNDKENFDQALLRLNQDGRVSAFLAQLDGVIAERISKQHIGDVIAALIDCADLFPDEKTTALSFATATRVQRICHQLLHRIESPEERFLMMRNAIMQANKSLYIIVSEIRQQEKQHIETADTFLPLEHRDFTPMQLQQLQKAAVEKIQYWVSIGRLGEHPRLLPILYAWKNWGNPVEVQIYVAELTHEERGLLAFLGAALAVPVAETMAKLEKQTSWDKYLQQITDFVPIEVIAGHAQRLFTSEAFEQLREHEQVAILIFLDLIKATTIKTISKTVS